MVNATAMKEKPNFFILNSINERAERLTFADRMEQAYIDHQSVALNVTVTHSTGSACSISFFA